MTDLSLTLLPEVIDQLPERERTVINGLFFERVSMGEIAKSLGTDRKGVQRIRDYALTMLRGALQEACEQFADTLKDDDV